MERYARGTTRPRLVRSWGYAGSKAARRRPSSQEVIIASQLAVMTTLRDEGKIGGIGLSAITLDVLRRALPAGIVCVRNAYSLVARADEEMLRLCVEEKIAWVPFFPLGGTFPGMPKVTDDPTVTAAAESLGRTPAPAHRTFPSADRLDSLNFLGI